MPNTPHYIDPRTGRTHGLLERRWRSDDGHPMMITALPGISRDDIDTRVRSLWRYRAALPVAIEQPASLGEGCTPLVQKRWGGLEPFFKLEWFNPTCSFKDRGAAVMMSFLRQIGVDAVLEDSSGNGGAAIAASGAAAGLRVKVLAPAYTPAPKVAQIRAFGAEVQLVPGPREASEEEAVRQSNEIFYASHNWHPFFLQGTKLIAYEIWEDLGFRAPDNVLIPTGAGSLALGCSIGFNELLRAGEIERIPRLLVVQPEHCSPLARAFAAGADEALAGDWQPTIAEGTSIARPVRDREVLEAVRESQGTIVAVPEHEIAPAVRTLAQHGLYAEPTSAIVVAALGRLAIEPGETVVAVLTGSGLKAASAMARLLDR